MPLLQWPPCGFGVSLMILHHLETASWFDPINFKTIRDPKWLVTIFNISVSFQQVPKKNIASEKNATKKDKTKKRKCFKQQQQQQVDNHIFKKKKNFKVYTTISCSDWYRNPRLGCIFCAALNRSWIQVRGKRQVTSAPCRMDEHDACWYRKYT